jgi:diketogulonate reductase-like aldo/keto reductase
MPLLGLGVYRNRGETVVSACLAAFEAGYRCVVRRLSQWTDNDSITGTSIQHSYTVTKQVGLLLKISTMSSP